MTDELITLETARLAREKGWFDLWDDNDRTQPTQSLLARWLREEHKIFVTATYATIGSDEWEWAYNIDWLPKDRENEKRRSQFFSHKFFYDESPGGTHIGAWPTYEQALEEGLKEGLKLI